MVYTIIVSRLMNLVSFSIKDFDFKIKNKNMDIIMVVAT